MHFSECVTEQAGLSLRQKRHSEVRSALDLAYREGVNVTFLRAVSTYTQLRAGSVNLIIDP